MDKAWKRCPLFNPVEEGGEISNFFEQDLGLFEKLQRLAAFQPMAVIKPSMG